MQVAGRRWGGRVIIVEFNRGENLGIRADMAFETGPTNERLRTRAHGKVEAGDLNVRTDRTVRKASDLTVAPGRCSG